MSDETGIDFGALRQQAEAMLDAPEVAPVAEPVVEAAPVAEAPVAPAATGQAPTPAEVAATPTPEQAAQVSPTELSDDTLVKVTIDGEEQIVPWKEAKAGYSRTAKFTKSMQQIAADRKQIDAAKSHVQELENQQNILRNFLRDPNAVRAYIAQAFPAAQEPQHATQNPDEIITAGQAEAIARTQFDAVQRNLAQAEQSVQGRIDRAIANLENARQTAAHATVISSTLSDIFTKNPVLNAIPQAEDLIRYNVSQLNPQTEAEALDAFRQVASGMVEEIGKHYKANEKIQKVAAAKAKLDSSSIEPVGGAAPQQKPTNFKNADGSVNWNAVTSAAKAML